MTLLTFVLPRQHSAYIILKTRQNLQIQSRNVRLENGIWKPTRWRNPDDCVSVSNPLLSLKHFSSSRNGLTIGWTFNSIKGWNGKFLALSCGMYRQLDLVQKSLYRHVHGRLSAATPPPPSVIAPVVNLYGASENAVRDLVLRFRGPAKILCYPTTKTNWLDLKQTAVLDGTQTYWTPDLG